MPQHYYADLEAPAPGLPRNPMVRRLLARFPRAAARPERAPLYSYADPLGQFAAQFERFGGVRDLFDPSGRAYAEPVEDLLRMEGAGRARGAMLAARRSAIPGFASFAGLSAGLGAASDLARGLGAARARGVEASQRFRGGLLGDIMGYGFAGERGERQFEQQRALERERQAHERRLERERRKAQQRGFLSSALGGLAGSFLGPLGTAAGDTLARRFFREGGVAGEEGPEVAVLGEEEPELVIPLSVLASGPPAIRDFVGRQGRGSYADVLDDGPETADMLARWGEDVGPRILRGRRLLGERAERAAMGQGGLAGGKMNAPAAASPWPAMPVPYREPTAAEPAGYWERVGVNLSELATPGLEAGFWPHLITAAGRGASRALTAPLAARQQERQAASALVDRLNRLQELGYQESLRARERAMAEPELPWEEELRRAEQMAEVRARGTVAGGLGQERLAMGQEAAAAGRLNQIADRYERDPRVKGYMMMLSNVATGVDAARQQNGAGDVALIFSYMRALEPDNQNVVREGDVRLVREAISLLNKLKIAPQRLMRGDLLTPEAREMFLRQMRDALKTRARGLERANSIYRARARRFGVDPGYFIYDPVMEEAALLGEEAAAEPSEADRAYVRSLRLPGGQP
jgi:hypothetical protein